MNGPAHGIMFHHFHGGRHAPTQGSMSAQQLRDMVEFLGRENILSARQWLERALAGDLRENDLCLTFDDNLRCQYDVAGPVLEDNGIAAFWFVYTSVMRGNIEPLEVYRRFRSSFFESIEEFYTGFFQALAESPHAREVEEALAAAAVSSYLPDFPFYTESDRRFRFVRDEVLGHQRYNRVMERMMLAAGVRQADLARDLWMDDDCILRLHADGHVIGMHSDTHPTRIGQLDAAGQRQEYTANFEYLRRLLGVPPVSMSHPCNSYSGRTLGILRELGIRLGFRANMAKRRYCELEHPREDHANILREMAK